MRLLIKSISHSILYNKMPIIIMTIIIIIIIMTIIIMTIIITVIIIIHKI